MPVEVQFQPGSQPLLTTLLTSIKDFLPTNAANLIFTPRGLALRFASGRNTDSRVVVACHLDAEANHRPFTFTRNSPGRRRSSVGTVQAIRDFEDARSEGGESAMSMPESKADREKVLATANGNGNVNDVAATQGMYGIIGKYVCQKEAVLVGFNPVLMIEQLKLVDEDDSITIRAEEAEDGSVQIYEMYIESQDLTRKCLYEVDAIPLIDRFVPLPDIQYSIVCQIQTNEFTRIVNALHGTSDKIVIIANKNSITFCASGSDGTLQVGLVQKPSPSEKARFKVLSFQNPVKHVVDSRLLKGFTQASPLSSHVLLFLPPTPSPARPAAPLRVTFEITVVELPGGSVVLSSEFNPIKHMPPPKPVSHPTPIQNPRSSTSEVGWRSPMSSTAPSPRRPSVMESPVVSSNPTTPTAPPVEKEKTFASVAKSSDEKKDDKESKFLGISAPRNPTPIGVHSGLGNSVVNVLEDAQDEELVRFRVVGQLHYLLAPELGSM